MSLQPTPNRDSSKEENLSSLKQLTKAEQKLSELLKALWFSPNDLKQKYTNEELDDMLVSVARSGEIDPNVPYDFSREHDSEPDWHYPLCVSLICGYPKLALELLDRGATIPELNYAQGRSSERYSDFDKSLLSYRSEPEIVERLLSLGADPVDYSNRRGKVKFPLNYLVTNNSILINEGFELLLNVTLEKLESKPELREYRTSLLNGALGSLIYRIQCEGLDTDGSSSFLPLVDKVLEAGADPKIGVGNSMEPIRYAVKAARNPAGGIVIKKLIKHDPEALNVRLSDGFAPIHFAAKLLNKIAIDTLLELGASKTITVEPETLSDEEREEVAKYPEFCVIGKNAYEIVQTHFRAEKVLQEEMGDNTVRFNPYSGMLVLSPMGPSISLAEAEILRPDF